MQPNHQQIIVKMKCLQMNVFFYGMVEGNSYPLPHLQLSEEVFVWLKIKVSSKSLNHYSI